MCRAYVSLCWYPRVVAQVFYLRWLLFLLRKLLITFGIKVCREWKLGRVGIGREGCEIIFFFLIWTIWSYPGLCPQSSWVCCVLPERRGYPGLLLSRGVLCWWTSRAASSAVSSAWEQGARWRGQGKEGCRKDKDAVLQALPARNAASVQRATLPLCRSVPQGWAASSQPRFPPGERLCSPVRLLPLLSSALRASP